jgi:hypothetical protein
MKCFVPARQVSFKHENSIFFNKFHDCVQKCANIVELCETWHAHTCEPVSCSWRRGGGRGRVLNKAGRSRYMKRPVYPPFSDDATAYPSPPTITRSEYWSKASPSPPPPYTSTAFSAEQVPNAQSVLPVRLVSAHCVACIRTEVHFVYGMFLYRI